jgi:hypothetical protein
LLLRESEEKHHAGGRPRKYPLRLVTDAVLYVVKTGCQWRQLPMNFPPWLRIPVKWAGDSGDVGQSRSEATLVVFLH